MAFLQKHIRIIWWLTAFAAANVAWLLIANISIAPIEEAQQTDLDNVFFGALAFVALAVFFALIAMFARRATGLFVKLWLGYLALYVIAALATYALIPAFTAASEIL